MLRTFFIYNIITFVMTGKEKNDKCHKKVVTKNRCFQAVTTL